MAKAQANTKAKNSGFTLVEVIVVLVILAILAAILIPSLTGYIDKAQEQAVKSELHNVAMAAQSAYAEIYALYSPAENSAIIYPYNNALDPISTAFSNTFKEYMKGDDNLKNVTGIGIIAQHALRIQYKQDGVTYIYNSDENGVTITKLP